MMVNADYTGMSSLLLSSLCTGYGLRSVEMRIDLQSRVDKEDSTNEFKDLEEANTDTVTAVSSLGKSPGRDLMVSKCAIKGLRLELN